MNTKIVIKHFLYSNIVVIITIQHNYNIGIEKYVFFLNKQYVNA